MFSIKIIQYLNSFFLIMCFSVNAELLIESITPTHSLPNEPIDVVITGKGFDKSTRVSMYLDTMHKKNVLSTLTFSHTPNDVVVSDNIAYVADGVGIQIIDITVPEEPMLISTLKTPGYSKAISIANKHVYVAAGYACLQIIDVSKPKEPTLITSLDLNIYVEDVEFINDLLFLITGSQNTTLKIFDVQQPTHPSILSSIKSDEYFHSIALANDKIFVSNGNKIEVIDFSQPEKPTTIGAIDISAVSWSKPDGITVKNNYVYVATTEQFLIIDFSQLTNPNIVGSVRTESSYRNEGLSIFKNKAFIAKQDCGVNVIDISKPENPLFVGNIDTPIYTNAITVAGTNAIVACDAGIQIIDINTTSTPKIVGSLYRPSLSFCTKIVGNIIYTAGYGLQIIDISTPTNPKIIGLIGLNSVAQDIVVAGEKVFIAGNSTMEIVDIKDLSNPQILGTLDISSYDSKLFVEGNNVYLKTYNELKIIDVIDPKTPKLLGTIDILGSAPGISISGNIAYIANGNEGLQIFDISDRTKPIKIGYMDTPGYASDITIKGSDVFISGRDFGVQIIDVNQPTYPLIVSSIPIFTYDLIIKIQNNKAYIGGGNKGVSIFDITKINNPILEGVFDSSEYIYDIDVNNLGNAIIIDSYGSIQIIDLDTPKKPQTLSQINISKGLGKCVKGYNQIFAAGHSDIFIIDTMIKDKPSISASIHFSCSDFVVIGYRAYIVEDSTFSIVDISDPQETKVLSELKTDVTNCKRIIISANNAYLIGETGIQVIKIPDPNSPIEVVTDTKPIKIGLIEISNCKDISVYGNKLYVSYRDKLQIIDIRDPQQPIMNGLVEYNYYSNGIRKLLISNNYAYVAGTTTLTTIDIKNSMEPRIVHSVTELCYSDERGIAFDDNIIYLTDERVGIYAIDITKPEQPVIIGSVDTYGVTQGGICIFDDTAYLGTSIGLEVVNLPIELLNFHINNESNIIATIQNPYPLENYIIRVFNNNEYDELISFDNISSQLYGDINKNEQLDLQDVIMTLQILSGNNNSELNVLSRIDLKDAIYLINNVSH